MKRKLFIIKMMILALVLTAFSLPAVVNGQTDSKKAEPTVEGNAPAITPEDEATKKWQEEKLKRLKKGEKQAAEQPKSTAIAPKTRKRGGDANVCGSATYKGKCSIYQFVNPDMPDSDHNCGTAAIATALWNIGLNDPAVFSNNKEYFAREVYRIAPPKITLAGWVPINSRVGMDWRQLNNGLDAFKKFGVKYTWFTGEAELQKYLAMGLPVAMMLDLGALPNGYSDKTFGGGHWVVAFGYDSTYYYLTNFGNNKIRRSDLRDAWGASPNPFVGVLAKGHGTPGMGVVIWR